MGRIEQYTRVPGMNQSLAVSTITMNAILDQRVGGRLAQKIAGFLPQPPHNA